MSTEQKKDWFSILGLVKDKAKILEWGMKRFPIYAKNENMMAQMWWTQELNKVLPEQKSIITIEALRKKVKAFVDADDLVDEKGKPRKAWGNIEVLVVGPLGDSKPYFGCEKCTRGIDRNIKICLNDDAEYGHPGEEIEGKMIAWQNWQIGDGTDEAIMSFAPNNKQTPQQIQGRVLVLEGSMNVRDGRYSVWSIVANRTAASPGGSGENIDMMMPEPEVVLEAETVEEEITDEVTDESTPSATEELIDGDESFFEDAVEETETGTDLKSRIPNYDGLVKAFEKSLERHVGTKKVPVENIHRFLIVRPQLRGLGTQEEVSGLASEFLEQMVVDKRIIVDDNGFLTRA